MARDRGAHACDADELGPALRHRSKLRKAEEQEEHCERIATLEEQISLDYEALSKEDAAQLRR
jgi:L-rhamnose isomerase